ncbi:MAG: 16S rRNA (cytosine(1402)-N(4))-methyltransferase, partial [Propionibacteriaceae bacterium]|nr:16S rRNA (cytosine(1402)-N(4))-methyltransferase [Propionibacteriaceae bacterium]
MSTVATVHVPVLRERVIELLTPAMSASQPWLIDCTLGLAGHAKAALEAFENVRLLGIDRDQQALTIAAQRLTEFSDRIELVHAEFDQLTQVMDDIGVNKAAGILLDLGLSSMQIDQPERGFSYMS